MITNLTAVLVHAQERHVLHELEVFLMPVLEWSGGVAMGRYCKLQAVGKHHSITQGEALLCSYSSSYCPTAPVPLLLTHFPCWPSSTFQRRTGMLICKCRLPPVLVVERRIGGKLMGMWEGIGYREINGAHGTHKKFWEPAKIQWDK